MRRQRCVQPDLVGTKPAQGRPHRNSQQRRQLNSDSQCNRLRAQCRPASGRARCPASHPRLWYPPSRQHFVARNPHHHQLRQRFGHRRSRRFRGLNRVCWHRWLRRDLAEPVMHRQHHVHSNRRGSPLGDAQHHFIVHRREWRYRYRSSRRAIVRRWPDHQQRCSIPTRSYRPELLR